MKAPVASPSRPPSPVDHNDIAELQKRLIELATTLSDMSADVAKARTVREFNGEQRKRALALAVREFLKDESATAAETKGRSSVAYGEALMKFSEEFKAAEAVIAHFDATRTAWESVRSVLSSQRAIAGNL